MILSFLAGLVSLFLCGVLLLTDVAKSTEVAGIIIMLQVLCMLIVFRGSDEGESW